jgi:hypothetical protein
MGLGEEWEMEAGAWWLFCLEGLIRYRGFKDIKVYRSE